MVYARAHDFFIHAVPGLIVAREAKTIVGLLRLVKVKAKQCDRSRLLCENAKDSSHPSCRATWRFPAKDYSDPGRRRA